MTTPSLIWITDDELCVTMLTGALRELTDIGLAYRRVHVSDLWSPNDPFGSTIVAHRRALGGELVSFEADAHGSTYRIELEPLQAPDGSPAGVSGRAICVLEGNGEHSADDGSRERVA